MSGALVFDPVREGILLGTVAIAGRGAVSDGEACMLLTREL